MLDFQENSNSPMERLFHCIRCRRFYNVKFKCTLHVGFSRDCIKKNHESWVNYIVFIMVPTYCDCCGEMNHWTGGWYVETFYSVLIIHRRCYNVVFSSVQLQFLYSAFSIHWRPIDTSSKMKITKYLDLYSVIFIRLGNTHANTSSKSKKNRQLIKNIRDRSRKW